MLPIAAGQQCSIWFSILQTFVGGWFSSLAFIINMALAGIAFSALKAYKARKATVREDLDKAAAYIKNY